MNITEVRVRLVKKEEGKLRAAASVTFDDCFVVHDVKIIEGQGTVGLEILQQSRAAVDAELFGVSRDVVRSLCSVLRDDVLFGVLRSLEDEPDR